MLSGQMYSSIIVMEFRGGFCFCGVHDLRMALSLV
jgi:hypothetical protein